MTVRRVSGADRHIGSDQRREEEPDVPLGRCHHDKISSDGCPRLRGVCFPLDDEQHIPRVESAERLT